MSSDFDPLIDKTEMLTRLGGITYPVVWKMVREGRFPPGRYIGGRLFWRLSEIENFIESQPRQGEAPPPAKLVKATAASPHSGRRKGGKNRPRPPVPTREKEKMSA